MTNSQLTREKVQWLHDEAEEAAAVGIKLTMNPSELLMFTSSLLAAMDSEPVAEVYQSPNVGICAALGPSIRMLCPLEPGTKLYRHAQPAPTSEPMDEIYAELYRLREEVKGPDGFNTWRDAAIAEKKARVELERQINQSGRDIDYLGAMAAFHSDKWHKMDPITGYMHGWNARRNHAQPASVVPDGYVMVPVEPTAEMIAAAMNCEDVLFNNDESFCVQFGNIYEAMLAAAPQ